MMVMILILVVVIPLGKKMLQSSRMRYQYKITIPFQYAIYFPQKLMAISTVILALAAVVVLIVVITSTVIVVVVVIICIMIIFFGLFFFFFFFWEKHDCIEGSYKVEDTSRCYL